MNQHLLWSLKRLLIGLLLWPVSIRAQQPGALDVLRALPLDSLEGSIVVYYSPGHTERAAMLQQKYEAAVAFYEDTLSYDFDACLAVLTDEHWKAFTWGPPYGMPWITYKAPHPPVAVMPATTDHGVVVDMLHRSQDDEAARRTIETIGFHEFGHALTQQYLYPGQGPRTPPLRWFDEMMATYMGQGYQWLMEAETGEPLASLFGDMRPRYTSLNDFEVHYWELASAMDASNYAWYQTQLQRQARAVFDEQGIAFIQRLKDTLPWDRFDRWTTDDLLLWLDKVAPGFQAWADGLGM